MLGRVLRWAAGAADVRAVLLESSRARPGAPRDALTDYDLALLVTDPAAYAEPGDWVRVFGAPLLRVRDVVEITALAGPLPAPLRVQNDMLLFADGAKIDFGIWPVTIARHIAEQGALPEEWDHAYQVLLDKDGLTRAWPAPTGDAYALRPPTAAEFQAAVEEFWWLCTYVAKNLWRDELLTAQVLFDYELRHLILLRFVTWRVGLDSGWTARPGFFGRGLPGLMGAALGDAWLISAGSGSLPALWDALWRTIALFRELAQGIAKAMHYPYPAVLDAAMVEYLSGIRHLPRP